MAYKCCDCGHIFEDGEQKRWSESRGEFWGFRSFEEVSGCPLCEGDYEETTPCEVCGSEHLEEELDCGVCDECIEKYSKDVDMCFAVGTHDTKSIEINVFLASVFEKQEIEEILFRELKEAEKYKKDQIQNLCEKFVEDDRSWFAEILAKEVSEDENAKG